MAETIPENEPSPSKKRGRVRAGIMTGDGTYVSPGDLEKMQLGVFMKGLDSEAQLRILEKSGSAGQPVGGKGGQPFQELQQDPSHGVINDPFAVAPPYNFDTLRSLKRSNVVHDAAISAKANDYAYNGWELVVREEAVGLVSRKKLKDAKRIVEDFLCSVVEGSLPIEDLIRTIGDDYESMGSCGFEVIRNKSGFIAGLNHIPFNSMAVTNAKMHNSPTQPHFIQMRFNKKRLYVPLNRNVRYRRPGFDPLTAPMKNFPTLNNREKFISLTKTFSDNTNEKEFTSDVKKAATEFYMVCRPPKFDSTMYGTPSAMSAQLSMLADLKTEVYNINFFNAKGVPQYAVIVNNGSQSIGYDDDDDIDSEAELQETINEFFSKHLKASDRSVLVMHTEGEGSVEFKRLSAESIDASFDQYEKRNRDKVRMAHGVPPAALGIIETANLGSGSSTSQFIRYRDHIVAPGQRIFASVVNAIIKSGLLIPYFEFRFLPMSVEDEDDRRKRKIEEFISGAISPNEYREETGRNPFTSVEQGEDAGDALYIRNAQISIVKSDGTIQTTLPGEEPTLGKEKDPSRMEPSPKSPDGDTASSSDSQ
jgi:PBSX family phage portal protein